MLTLRHGQAIVLRAETHLITEHCADPQLICVGLHSLFPLPSWTLFTRSAIVQFSDPVLGLEYIGDLSPHVQSASWPLQDSAMHDYLRDLFLHCNLIVYRGCFDLACIASTYPDLLPFIDELIDRGGVYDVRIAAAHAENAADPQRAGLPRPILQGWENQFNDRGAFLNLPALSTAHKGPHIKGAVRFSDLGNLPPRLWPAAEIAAHVKDLTATGWIQVQQCLNERNQEPEAPVITPGSWAQGVIATATWDAHKQHCRSVKEADLRPTEAAQ